MILKGFGGCSKDLLGFERTWSSCEGCYCASGLVLEGFNAFCGLDFYVRFCCKLLQGSYIMGMRLEGVAAFASGAEAWFWSVSEFF